MGWTSTSLTLQHHGRTGARLRHDEHTGKHSAPGLWSLIDRTPRDCWPALLRGDAGIASESTMAGAERRGIAGLFKLRLTKTVKVLIERTFSRGGWHDAGQGWQGQEAELRLVGWSRHHAGSMSPT